MERERGRARGKWKGGERKNYKIARNNNINHNNNNYSNKNY